MLKHDNCVYVLLTDTGSIFTHTIKQFTNAPYNHASISFDPFLNEVYSFGRKKAYNPILAGFVKEDIYHGTFSYFPDTTCALFKIPVSESQLSVLRETINIFLKNKNVYKYNLIGLVGVPLNISYNRKNAYFCSEFVSEVLTKSNIINFNKDTCLVTPDDFRINFKDSLVYEGPLYEYPLLNKNLYNFKKYRNHLSIRRMVGWSR
jgi:hypothetical protein